MTKFRIEDMLRRECPVTRSRIELIDRRTGEKYERTFAHPGENYPKTDLFQACEKMGFGVLSFEKLETRNGAIPWDDIFDLLGQECDE